MNKKQIFFPGRITAFFFVFLCMLTWKEIALSEEWRCFGGDERRSGYSPDSLPEKLSLQWLYHSRHAPQPAWSGRDTRMPFDLGYHVVTSNNMIYFGSSADDKVYALDAETGTEKWTFFTNAPVRFAPLAWRDFLYVASDDGYLYCLEGKSGKEIWKHRGGPLESKVLGNGRMISRWPARGAPVISEGVLYYVAGIWPSEGIFIYALNPETGKVLWRNDSSGSIFMPQPHGGSDANSGVSAQGELVVCGDYLLLPTGRAVPAAFDRKNGEFLYFHLQNYGSGANGRGGARIVAEGDFFFNDGTFFETENGNLIYQMERNVLIAITPRNIVMAPPEKDIILLDRKNWHEKRKTVDRQGKTVEREALTTPAKTLSNPSLNLCSIVSTNNKIILGSGPFFGSNSFLCVKDMESGKETFREYLDGAPYGVAVSGSKIFVSTDKGSIYCFGEKKDKNPVMIEPKPDAEPYQGNSVYAKAAEEILNQANLKYGYCLDMGCGAGDLAYELAKRTHLQIYAIDSNPENVAQARRNLDGAGLYGVRVTVLYEEDLKRTSLPDYFADLIISGRAVAQGADFLNLEEAQRIQRPYGGIACIGKEGAISKSVRGEMDGAGLWTHQYGDSMNTNCSNEKILRGPLGMLWFEDLNFQMPNRHGRGHTPLYKNGVLVVQGLHGLLGVNGYNGRRIWNYPIKNLQKPYDQNEHLVGTAGTNSNICIGGENIFLRHKNKCLQISLMDGRLIRELGIPAELGGEKESWGYIAFYHGILFGSILDKDYIVKYLFQESDMSDLLTESQAIFALDAQTGEYKWSYKAKKSIRNNAIAIGKGKVFLIDCEQSEEDVLGYEERRGKEKERKPRSGELICLDAEDGKVLWRKDKGIYGTLLCLSERNDVLLMGYQYSQRSFQLPSEKGDRLSAFYAFDGTPLWEAREKYISRPVLIEDLVYTQPYARNMLTGELKKDFRLDDRAPCGCGNISGSRRMLFYRSGTLGYTDLVKNRGTENYGGIRPGCWINAIPVGGMLLMPDATDQCRCSYLIKSSIALIPYGLRAPHILPEERAFNKPVKVQISSDAKDVEIRYTLDGTNPNPASQLYSEPFEIKGSAVVKSRSFSGIYPPSPVTEAEFLIDPHALPIGDDYWEIYDSPGAEPAKSHWVVEAGTIKETSNIFKGVEGNDPGSERQGTFRIYEEGKVFQDGEFICNISSSDNDTLGVAFRFQDAEHYYLFAMDEQRKYHALAVKNGDEYKVLASNQKGYEVNKWQRLRIGLSGSRITVYLNEGKEFDLEDETFSRGAPALYSWGSAGAMFKNITWKPR
ncbi:PQQ-binding-like beta-propeller repeat protein [Candidatus Sumerlaeota bacterium]|nr:PQQ-binding-like beta-propeller repeat protein [Candidatus Sumerlaeota bacterium]